eukprot:scaffold319240_cov15-Prasinocladus_malaysianus.AAC.1
MAESKAFLPLNPCRTSLSDGIGRTTQDSNNKRQKSLLHLAVLFKTYSSKHTKLYKAVPRIDRLHMLAVVALLLDTRRVCQTSL